MHNVIAAAIAQWHTGSRLNACVRVIGDILNIHFEPLTFCCVLFASSIVVSANVIDINTYKVLILV